MTYFCIPFQCPSVMYMHTDTPTHATPTPIYLVNLINWSIPSTQKMNTPMEHFAVETNHRRQYLTWSIYGSQLDIAALQSLNRWSMGKKPQRWQFAVSIGKDSVNGTISYYIINIPVFSPLLWLFFSACHRIWYTLPIYLHKMGQLIVVVVGVAMLETVAVQNKLVLMILNQQHIAF